jgi:nitroimidazol reductase NimA-like FMN-containing flavoprotein (pyridoxamine 5'-phosphate oxidase superfamily)
VRLQFLKPLRILPFSGVSFLYEGDLVEMADTMNDQQARELLQSARIARLGCIVNGEPYIVPINYLFEGNYIYGHSLEGVKIAALRENPRACVQVDEVESDLRWSSALAFGRFEEIVKSSERTEILTKLLKRFPVMTPVESAIVRDGIALEIIVYRIRVDRITGVSEG